MYMNSKHVKRFSASVVSREMQIKTTVRYHFKSTGVAIIIITNSNSQVSVGEDIEKLELSHSGDVKWCCACVLSHSVMSDSATLWTCSPPDSSVHRILQARILEWVAILFSKGSSQPRDRTQVSCVAGRFLTV